jgi:hypothetical protein
MKKDNWLVYGIILLTSSTTVLTMVDGTFFGMLRGIGAAFVLDGLILFWESRSEKLTNTRQRDFANGMKWAGVGMLVAIAFAYVLTEVVPVDAKKTVDIFGLTFASTIRELVHWIIVGVISLWVVLTLGVVMYVREIDPETQKSIQLTKAHETQETEEMDAYKTSLKAIGKIRGIEKAIARLRADLKRDGCTPVEIEELVNKAMMEIREANGDPIPVDMNVKRYQQTAPAVDANFTDPSAGQTKRPTR